MKVRDKEIRTLLKSVAKKGKAMEGEKLWIGTVPKACDLCQQSLEAQFVDGRTLEGPWGCLCVPCHSMYGLGFGPGKGQLYQRQGLSWQKLRG